MICLHAFGRSYPRLVFEHLPDVDQDRASQQFHIVSVELDNEVLGQFLVYDGGIGPPTLLKSASTREFETSM